jgi:hypothetical protein
MQGPQVVQSLVLPEFFNKRSQTSILWVLKRVIGHTVAVIEGLEGAGQLTFSETSIWNST